MKGKPKEPSITTNMKRVGSWSSAALVVALATIAADLAERVTGQGKVEKNRPTIRNR